MSNFSKICSLLREDPSSPGDRFTGFDEPGFPAVCRDGSSWWAYDIDFGWLAFSWLRS